MQTEVPPSAALLAASMPPSAGPGVFGPSGDSYYLIFVGLVLVATVIGVILFYRKTPPEDRP